MELGRPVAQCASGSGVDPAILPGTAVAEPPDRLDVLRGNVQRDVALVPR